MGKPVRPTWDKRRRIIHLTLLFCAGVIVWMLLNGEDTALNQSIATGVLILAGSVIGSYVFGAAWDDRNVMQSLGEPAYREKDPTIPPEGYAS